jgi:hypothetical protein
MKSPLQQASALHLDPFSGVAGDMFLGLLVDLGLDPALLAALPARLGLEGVEVRAERATRGPLDAARVRVTVRGHEEPPAEPAGAGRGHHDHDHAPHGPGDAAHHDHDGHAPHDSGDAGHHHHHDGRRLSEMLAAFERAALPPRALARARRAAELLYAAEAKVHGVPLDAVHLHEAGADDALVDIAGTCLGLEELGVARVTCSAPVPLGGGAIRCAHGVLPVPVPAVVELLRGVPVAGGPIAKELVTPTGAALLVAVVDAFGPLPALTLERAGHGAGGRDDAALPNVLRGLLGTPAEDEALARRVAVLETALDDLLPQDVPVLIERLLAAGARDAMVAPVQMKKGRPGFHLTVICEPGEERRLAALLLHETPTLGVRMRVERRAEWDRDVIAVPTPWGPVRVKRAKDTRGRVLRAQPEFDDCRRAADAAGVTPDAVRQAARRAAGDLPAEDPR